MSGPMARGSVFPAHPKNLLQSIETRIPMYHTGNQLDVTYMDPLTFDHDFLPNASPGVLKVGQLVYSEVHSLAQVVRTLQLEVLHIRYATLEPRFLFSQDHAHDIRLPPIGAFVHTLRSNELSFRPRQGFPTTLKEHLLEDEELRM